MIGNRIAATIAAANIPNPTDGIIPNFTLFGAQFTQLWQKLLAGIWGMALVIAVVFLVLGFAQMATATASQNAMAHKEGRAKAFGAGISLGCLAALAVIVGAVLSIFG